MSTNVDDLNNYPLNEYLGNDSSDSEEEYIPQQTQPCYVQSLGHIKCNLTAEQLASIEMATQGLTKAQKKHIGMRNELVNVRTLESYGEGPSHGKGIDP